MYICLLNTQKAFDLGWHEGLLNMLNMIGTDPKLWRILKDMYRGFECAVLVENDISELFVVHQGAPLSLWLYQMYINYLIREVRESRVHNYVHTATRPIKPLV